MSINRPIRVLLIDDHALFRSGIKALLEHQPGVEVVGEAGGGLEGVELAKSLQPDIVFLDLNMPEFSGQMTLPLIKENTAQCKVIMLTVSEDGQDLIEALRSGADGYLLKNIEVDFLLETLQRVHRGESVLSASMISRLMQNLRAGDDGRDHIRAHENLSPREREVLHLIAQGAPNKTIARHLKLSEATVKIHLQHILRKLNVSSRVQAAVYAVENGLAGQAK